MSLKDLFSVKKVLPPISNEQIEEEVESIELLNSYAIEKNRIKFPVDFSTASNFAIFGSAEKYYEDSVNRIYQQYPYDGSRKEKIDWENSSSQLDIWFLENAYPKSTGYAIFSPDGWGTSVGSQINGYGEPTTKEYISIKGGPNQSSTATTLVDKFKDLNNQNQKANVYDVSNNRNNNLELNLSNGITLEFWLQKNSFITSSTQKEVIFDLWNNQLSSSSDYGRLTLELSGTTTSPFYLTIQSGTTGLTSLNLGSSVITTSSVANGNWNHYAISAINSGSSINVKFYVNGELNSQYSSGTNINTITGSMLANIGALRTAASGAYGTAIGWGKLSGSIDDFRYWKSLRTSREIGRNWWTNVYGGTNSDDANTELGVYYKFNEGVTTTSSIDSTVLDYSGRISNGTWIGYSSSSRSTGSAINLYSGANLSTEIGDPIIYVNHPDVQSVLEEYTTIGSDHDRNNPNSFYFSFPNWIIDEDDNGELLSLSQIISSYLDTLYLQIKYFTSIKEPYANIQIDEKPYPFASNLLESLGLITPQLFIDAKLIEEVLSRDEERNYEDKLHEIKNVIYENIYSNLQSILKTKGTEKAVRNLLRCFGIDESLVKLNIYANNDSKRVTNDLSNITLKKTSINFNDTDRFQSTIYQFSTASNVNSNSFITGSLAGTYDYTPFTFEVDTVFPQKLPINHPLFFPTLFLTSSIFGVHSANNTSTDLTWDTNDYCNFQVYAVRPELESPHATFYLSSSNSSIPLLSSSFYLDVYNNEKWTFAVKLHPQSIENANIVSGTTSQNYIVEFYGASTVGDTVIREFTSTGSITNAAGLSIIRSNKRFYVGAERTNFSGSLIKYTDIKVLDCKVWSSYLEKEEILAHAKDSDNYGINNAYRNWTVTDTNYNNILIPKLDTLLLHWNFNSITGSDAGSGTPNASDGKFIVDDLTSGSLTYSNYNSAFNNIKKYQYLGRGDYFLQNDTTIIDTQYLFTSRLNEFENIQNSNLINILSQDEQNQTRLRDTRPVNYFFSYEKSMYATISTEMLKLFSTILDFNKLVGNPVNKYRKEYKELSKLRQLFFLQVQNEPDLDKFLDFYKWIDSAVGKLLLQMVPASADTSHGLLNIIESHALERNKHQYKFPTLEFKDPNLETGFVSINKHLYNWKYGHRPVSQDESENCFYWNARAERNVTPLSSSNSGSNYSRQTILDVSLQTLNRKFTTPQHLDISREKQIKGGINYSQNKNLDFVNIATAPHGPMDADDVINVPANYLFVGIENTSSVIKDCNDTINPNEKVKYNFSVVHGRDYDPATLDYNQVIKSEIALPANFISGNITDGYNKELNDNLFSGIVITNLHNDSYGPAKEIPVQGPFTNAWVGGHQSRHVAINTGSDSYTTRPEAWKVLFGLLTSSVYQVTFGFVGSDYPYPEGNDYEPSYPVVAHKRATYYRDGTTKRPLNIANVQTTTGSNTLGNFSHRYQYAHKFGRTNRLGKLLPTSSVNTQTELKGILRTNTSGRIDFELPTTSRSQVILVNKFSAPGDYRTISRGYLNLYGEEYSPYNSLPFKNRTILGDGRRNNVVLTNDNHLYTPSIVSGSTLTFNSLMAKPSAFGGYESGSTSVASIHKVNRNPVWVVEYSGATPIITKEYDNGFYSYSIPKKDSGYSWIKNSLISTGSIDIWEDFGHASSLAILPVSGNSITSASLTATNSINFVGMSIGTAIIDTIQNNQCSSEDITTLGTLSPKIPATFRALILNRNGAYGFASFKQLSHQRNDKVLRQLNKTNNITVYDSATNTVSCYKEPSVYYRYPVMATIEYVGDPTQSTRFDVEFPYDTVVQLIENFDLANKINLNEPKTLIYDNLIAKLITDSDNYKLVSLSYKQQIYPNKIVQTIDEYKVRSSYQFLKENVGWRDSREDRNIIDPNLTIVSTPASVFEVTHSIWPLDQYNSTSSNYSISTSTSSVFNGFGLLQNNYVVFPVFLTSSSTASVYVGPLYNHNHLLASPTSWNSISSKTSVNISNNPNTYFFSTGSGLYDGTAPWKAGDISGKNPYYDSYDKWYDLIKFKNKNYQPLPEFKLVSAAPTNFTKIEAAINGNYSSVEGLTLTGSVIFNSSTEKKNFLESNVISNINDISNNIASKTANITLTCDSILKLNPEPSFYPSNRTLDIWNVLHNSTFDTVVVSDAGTTVTGDPANIGKNHFYRPFMQPGILFNSIKSGLAVDFPIITGSLIVTSSYYNANNAASGQIDYQIGNSEFDLRLPFDTIYEPESYAANVNFTNMIPKDASYRPLTASWNGTYVDNAAYKYIIHNFLAETVDFFLEDNKLTSIVSRPEEEFATVTPGKQYRALVKIYKSKDKNAKLTLNNRTYTRPQFLVASGTTYINTPTEQETITMYSRASAFGPPCAGGVRGYYSGSGYTKGVIDSTNGYYPSFTPPYYDGEAWAILTYNPTGSTPYKPSLEDLIQNITASYIRFEGQPDNNGSESTDGVHVVALSSSTTYSGPLSDGRLNLNSMQVSASLNLFNIVEIDSVNVNNTGTNSINTAKSKVWGIQTKFETPILDFGTTQNLYTSSIDKTIGMWHQYGELPSGNAGIYLQITDLPRDYILSGSETDSSQNVSGRVASSTGSLADIVGFSKTPLKLGKVAPSKEIKEAVVAIPYYKENDERKYFYFNDIANEYVSYIKTNQNDVQSFANLAQIPDSIINQVDLMQKYILPPSIDFIKNDVSNPFFMYIFEFSYTLSQQDLVDIWQGLMPNIAINFDEKSSSITHSLDIEETQTNLSMREKLANIQWLTFKIKYKAKNNYKAKLFESIKTTDTKKIVQNLQLTNTRNSLFTDSTELDYSYNWPYDYFSMIEAAKITAQVDFIASDYLSSVSEIVQNTVQSLTNPTLNTGNQFGITINDITSTTTGTDVLNASTATTNRSLNLQSIPRLEETPVTTLSTTLSSQPTEIASADAVTVTNTVSTTLRR